MKALHWYYIVAWATIVSMTLAVLKITDCITWKWVWVVSPLWITVSFFTILIALGVYVFYKEDQQKQKIKVTGLKRD